MRRRGHLFARCRVEFSPQNPEQLGHIAKQDLSSFDHRVTGGAKGHEQIERRAAGLAMMHGHNTVSIKPAWQPRQRC
jgi:hypothetical protein